MTSDINHYNFVEKFKFNETFRSILMEQIVSLDAFTKCMVKNKFSKIKDIDNKLKKLANNPTELIYHSHKHQFLDKFSLINDRYIIEKLTGRISKKYSEGPYSCWKNPQACACTANAIMSLNTSVLTNIMNIDTYDELISELKNEEEGAFALSVYASFFINYAGTQILFPGHAFVIIKVIENGGLAYRVVQSYIHEYSLKEFLKTKRGYYGSFDELEEKILKPWKEIINYKNCNWDSKVAKSYYQITNVSVAHLINAMPEKELTFDYSRTTTRRTTGQKIALIAAAFLGILYLTKKS